MVKHRRLDRASVVAKASELADAAGDVQGVTLTTLAAALRHSRAIALQPHQQPR